MSCSSCVTLLLSLCAGNRFLITCFCSFTDVDQHGILLVDFIGTLHPADGIWRTQSVWTTAAEGKILELCLLQVYIHVWSHQCSAYGWSCPVVLMVLCSWIPPSPCPIIKRSLRICEWKKDFIYYINDPPPCSSVGYFITYILLYLQFTSGSVLFMLWSTDISCFTPVIMIGMKTNIWEHFSINFEATYIGSGRNICLLSSYKIWG